MPNWPPPRLRTELALTNYFVLTYDNPVLSLWRAEAVLEQDHGLFRRICGCAAKGQPVRLAGMGPDTHSLPRIGQLPPQPHLRTGYCDTWKMAGKLANQ